MSIPNAGRKRESSDKEYIPLTKGVYRFRITELWINPLRSRPLISYGVKLNVVRVLSIEDILLKPEAFLGFNVFQSIGCTRGKEFIPNGLSMLREYEDIRYGESRIKTFIECLDGIPNSNITIALRSILDKEFVARTTMCTSPYDNREWAQVNLPMRKEDL